jgi:hypothetical protein
MLTERCTAGFRRKVAENWVTMQQAVVGNYRYLLCHNPEQHDSYADRNITRKHTEGIHIQKNKKNIRYSV